MSALRHLAFFVGFTLIVGLVSLLPHEVFRTTQGFLVGAAAILLLLLAAAVVLTPARRLLGRMFGFQTRDAPALAMAAESEWRDLLRPLFVALVCVAVAGLAALARTLR